MSVWIDGRSKHWQRRLASATGGWADSAVDCGVLGFWLEEVSKTWQTSVFSTERSLWGLRQGAL